MTMTVEAVTAMSNERTDRLEMGRLRRRLEALLLPGLSILVLVAAQCEPPHPSDDAGVESSEDSGNQGGLDAGGPQGSDAGGLSGRDAGGPSTGGGDEPGSRDGGKPAIVDAGASGNVDAGKPAIVDAGVPGSVDAGVPLNGTGSCESLPPVTDYGAPGPFNDVKTESNIGPSSNYTLFRPGDSLGRNGFKHPIVTWGNGITTVPGFYMSLLTQIASHGFVIIACNDTTAERPCLNAGLDWLVQQNQSGAMAGKLDVTREATVGYSWGGGAAIDTANRPNVKATVSLHGMPPRQSNAFDSMHSPLLLFTSTGDTFVSASGYVTPNYNKSKVQTFYATLNDATASHLYVIDLGGGAKEEQAPTVAWLRMLACNDKKARELFYGADCKLCKSPWTGQKKSWPQPDSP
jgi:dienelactone hydrolase